MDGLRKRISRFTTLFLSLVLCITIYGQDSGSRIERAISDRGGVTLQVSVPRGRTIESGILEASGQSISIQAAPVSSDVTLWLILDQSEAVINAAPIIQTGINRFINGFGTNTKIGVLLYGNQVYPYYPTTNHSEINTWLSTYSGKANTANCISAALDAIQEQLSETNEASRVLIVAGAPVRQGGCPVVDTNLSVPIDMIIVSDTIDPIYEDIKDQFGGRLFRANVQTISNRLDEVKALWSNPIYKVSGQLSNTIEFAKLTLTLSDNTRTKLDVQFEQIVDIISEQSNSSGLTTLNDIVTQPSTIENTGENSELSQVAEVQMTQVSEPAQVVPANTQSSPELTSLPTAIAQNDTKSTSSSITIIAQPNLTASTQENKQSLDPESSNLIDTLLTQPLILLGSGIVLVIILLLLLVLKRRSRSKHKNSKSDNFQDYTSQWNTTPKNDIHTETVIETTQIEFTDEPIAVDDPYDMTEMFEPEPIVEESIDMFEITEIVTEDELLNSSRLPVAQLVDEANQMTYGIYRPSVVLGRQDDVDIVIHNDKAISRQHIRFLVNENDEIEVEILTQNPILVNHNRLLNFTKLSNDDVLILSQSTELKIVFTKEGNES